MPNPNEQQDNNKIIEAAVNVGLAVEQANEATNTAILDIVTRGEALGTGFNAKAVSEGLNKAWEGTKSVAGTAKNIAVGIGENWWDSYTKRGNIATFYNGKPKQPTEEQIEAANQVVKKYSLDKQGIAKIPRAAFHLTTALPVCTDKAVLRCSFGIGVGPLTVSPQNRTQIGTPANYVATVMDFTPFNMPQFIMCGNILNPYVASASAIASAAAGCFVLVPMPCIGTRAPTPWIPTTKNTCGKMPLLTQTSCSTCWGIGCINILHCGQGLTNSYRFLVPGADGSTDYWATTKVMIESLVNLAGGIGGGFTALSQLTKAISNTFKLAKLERVANATKNIANSKAFKTVTEAVDIGGNSIHLGMSIKEDDTAGITSDAINIGTSLAFKGRALYKENKAAKIGEPSTQRLNQANNHLEESNTDLRDAIRAEAKASSELGTAKGRVDEADAIRTSTKKDLEDANSNLNNAHEKLKNADDKLTDAQGNYNRAESELNNAKGKQSEASRNLDDAKTKQADAERKTQEAKGEFDDANTKLNEAKAKQADADRELSDAQKKKEEVYSNPNSTKEDKLAADMDVAMAKGNKGMADADVNAATKEKLEAESNYHDAQSIEGEARLNTIDRDVEKQKADANVIFKQNDFNKADTNLNTKKTEYDNAMADVEQREVEYSKAFDKNQKAEGEWADAQSEFHKKEDIHDHAQEESQKAAAKKKKDREELDEQASRYNEHLDRYNEASTNTTGDKVASHVAGWGKDPAKGVVTGTITEREEAEKAAKEEAKKKAKEKAEKEAKGKMRDEFDAFLPD